MTITTEDQTREYMISRAKTCLQKGDPSYAKSWIMTANALFPQNDKIKMESYEMSKCEGNVEEAVKYLCEMFETKQCEQQLRHELNKIVISCRNEWQTYHLNEQQLQAVFNTDSTTSANCNLFYTKLFGALSSQYQYKLLKRVTDAVEDRLVVIDLLLYILKKFPDSVVDNGLKLIEIMNEKSDRTQSNNSQHVTNYLKKKLVFDVLPLIFGTESKLVVDSDTTDKLMEKSLKFFVERLIACQTDPISEILDSTHVPNSSNKDLDDSLELKIRQIFQLIGRKNDWKLFDKIDLINEKQSELIYERISDFINELVFTTDTDSPIDLSSASTAVIKGDEQSNKQILYATLLLFLHCLRKYSKLSNDFVLIEETKHTLNESKIALSLNKKRKLSDPIIMAKNVELKDTFVTACKALKLLNDNLINSEFGQISESIGLSQCLVYNSFIIDANLYRGEYSEVSSLLTARKSFGIKANVQLISAALMVHDWSATLKHCLDSIETLPHLKSGSSKESLDNDLRQSSAISVITLCLKEKVLFSLKPSDLGVGHLLVLSQYKWPNNLQLFLSCIAFIINGQQSSQTPHKFIYHQFFNYIFVPDIIEEFMSIVDTGTIVLELKPSMSTLGTTLKTSSKIITTRGVNKGVKEEMRTALIQQMNVSKTHIDNDLFVEFINKEIRSFLPTITRC